MSRTSKARAWALTQPRKSHGGVRCWLCSHKDAGEAVAEFAAMNEAGEADVSYHQMVTFLAQEFKFPFRAGVVRNHQVNHAK